MIHFNEEAVKYGVAMCKSRPHYKVCVVITQAHQTEAFEAIYSAIDGENCIVRKSSVYIQVTFSNGSYIRTIPATDNARGYRAHLMIVDDCADREIIECVLRPHEILEDVDRQRQTHRQIHEYRADFVFVDEIAGGEPVNTFLNEYDAKFDGEIENEKIIDDIDEEEFMNILNIPSPR